MDQQGCMYRNLLFYLPLGIWKNDRDYYSGYAKNASCEPVR
jgi:hypothetical protein